LNRQYRSDLELILFRLDESAGGKQAHDLAEPPIRAVHESAEVPAARESSVGESATLHVCQGLCIMEEPERRLALLLIRDHQHDAMGRNEVAGSLGGIVSPHGSIRRKNDALQPLILDGKSSRQLACKLAAFRGVERRVQN